MRRLYILRPEPGASGTAGRARELGLDVVVTPLFEVRSVEWQVPEPAGFDAILLTSANAVRHGGAQLARLRGLPVHAVGEATADAAREAGFAIASTGDSGVERLLRSIEPDVRLLHLTGAHRSSASETRQVITPLVVYRADAIGRPDLSGLPGQVAAVHSPRAGARLAELATDRASIALAAISAAAAEAAGAGWNEVKIAAAPTDEALLASAAKLCDKAPADDDG